MKCENAKFLRISYIGRIEYSYVWCC